MERMTKQLADTNRCGVYQLARKPEEVERAAGDAGLTVFRIDIGNVKSKEDFLALIAKELQFPDWFGANWDALNDCLTDLTKNGYVLIFENCENFAAGHKREFERAIAVFVAAAEYWKTQGHPFWILIEVSGKWDPGLPQWPVV
jgi:RNAse (barnase) inhibitor barstar